MLRCFNLIEDFVNQKQHGLELLIYIIIAHQNVEIQYKTQRQ